MGRSNQSENDLAVGNSVNAGVRRYQRATFPGEVCVVNRVAVPLRLARTCSARSSLIVTGWAILLTRALAATGQASSARSDSGPPSKLTPSTTRAGPTWLTSGGNGGVIPTATSSTDDGTSCRGGVQPAEHLRRGLGRVHVGGLGQLPVPRPGPQPERGDHADLFWAARGSGPGFFGVVTAFRLRTRPRYRELTQTTYVYPAEAAPEVLGWLHTARHDVPSSVELVAVGITPPLPPEVNHAGPALVVDGVSFDGGPESLRALDTCPVAGKALVSKIAQPVTIGELRAEQVRANPEGHRYTVDNAYLAGETSALIPALTPAFTELPTAKSFSLWFDLAHLPARPLPEMALSVQTDLYFATYVVGEEPAQDDLCRSWTDDTMRRLAPFSARCYLGDSDLTVRPDRFMSDAAWARFRQVRAARDPGRLFVGYDCPDESALNRAEERYQP